MLNEIYIDISSQPGVGKTTTCLLIESYLKNLGISVEIKDIDLDQNIPAVRAQMLQKALNKDLFADRKIIIRTRQLSSDLQRDENNEILPGCLTVREFNGT